MKKNQFQIDETLPHQMNSPSWKNTGIPMEEPFVNDYGVIIGDSFYDSPHSPLNQWSEEVNPEIMSGSQWVHPTNDIGWNTSENRDIVERQRRPKGAPFMHPSKDVSYDQD